MGKLDSLACVLELLELDMQKKKIIDLFMMASLE